MKILFVTPPPYLPNRLHRNRAFDLIRILAKRHEVHLLAVTTQKEEPKEFSQIRKVCKSVRIIKINKLTSLLNCLRLFTLPYEVAYCYSEKVRKEIKKIIDKENIDVVYLKRLRSAIYLDNLTGSTSKESSLSEATIRGGCGYRIIVDTTDAMSMFYFRMYKGHSLPKNLFYFWQAILYKRFERKIMEKIKEWIVCSPLDQKYLQKNRSDINIHVVPNPVDTNFFSPFSTSKESRRRLPRHLRGVVNFSPSRWPKDSSKVERVMLFRGLMDKPVNIDACLFFVKEIMPFVKQNIKDVRLFIVGPNPHRLVRKLHNGKDIFVTGFVKDVRKYIEATAISICPVRIASGTRFKILQSWAFGKPVVSTSSGAEGIFYKKNQNILVADDPKEFAQKIIALLKNKKLYDKLAKNGQDAVVRYYSFQAIGRQLEEVIQNVKRFK